MQKQCFRQSLLSVPFFFLNEILTLCLILTVLMTLLDIFAQTKILAVIFDNTVIQRYNFLFSKSNPWDR